MAFKLKRAYDPAGPLDGYRVLVERLWPRGIRKANLLLAEWSKDVAPSAALRKWFGHDPARWAEFQGRYRAELKAPTAAKKIRDLARRGKAGTVTLVFSAHDVEHNSALVLKRALERPPRDGRRRQPKSKDRSRRRSRPST